MAAGSLTELEAEDRTVITIPEAGRYLGLARSAAYAAAKRGELPVITLGRKHVVPVERLRRMLSGSQAAA